MRASIVCVGRLAREYQAVWRHYEDLLRPYLSSRCSRRPSRRCSLAAEQARAKEGTALLGLLRKGAFTVAVDGRGREYSSEEWSAFLADKKVDGQSHFQFVLGGAVGLDAARAGRRAGALVALRADLPSSDGPLHRAGAALPRAEDRAGRALPSLSGAETQETR